MAQPAPINVEPIVRDLSVTPQQLVTPSPTYPFVPEPGQDVISLQTSVKRLKEGYEMMTGQRGPNEYSLVEGLVSITKKTGNSIARILELTEVQATTTSALVAWTKILEADLYLGPTSITGRITEVERVVLESNQGLVSKVETLELQVNTADAGIIAQIQNLNSIVITGFQSDQGQINSIVTRTERLELQVNSPTSANNPVYASVTNEAFIRASVDNGLNGRLVNVEAGWGVYVTLNGVTGYMTLHGVLKHDYTVALGLEFQAHTFRMLDPSNGTNKQIFYYEAGKFRFTGDVTIDGNLIVLGTVNYPQITPNAATQGVIATGFNAATVGIATRGGKVVIVAGFEAVDDFVDLAISTNINPPYPSVYRSQLYRDGILLKNPKMSTDIFYQYQGFSSNSQGLVSYQVLRWVYSNPMTVIYEDWPAEGGHAYSFTGQLQGTYTIEIIELLR